MPKDVEAAGAGAPTLDMTPAEFRSVGYHVVDVIADFLAGLPGRPVAPAESPEAVRAALGERPLPEEAGEPVALVDEVAELMFAYNRLTAHPR
ncbi:MAG: aspartate aminotransferase family protein, partial [Alphaproteobacteria bacterium]